MCLCPCLCQALPSFSFTDTTVPLPLCPAAEQAEALAVPCHILQEKLQEPTGKVMRHPLQPRQCPSQAGGWRVLCGHKHGEAHTASFLLYPQNRMPVCLPVVSIFPWYLSSHGVYLPVVSIFEPESTRPTVGHSIRTGAPRKNFMMSRHW